MKKRIVVLSGAGVSAESGVKTFRDSDGLWENHRIEDVATPEAWKRNPELVQQFYNERRRQLLTVQPNLAHKILVELESDFDVQIITQNVDDLHERAGSKHVMHLHGELLKVRSEYYPKLVYDWSRDLLMGDFCDRGAQLRPDIVWFGESVPMIGPASELSETADIFLVIGTSLRVYPAASLMVYAPDFIPVFYVDPRPQLNYEMNMRSNLQIIEEPATTGMQKVAELLRKL